MWKYDENRMIALRESRGFTQTQFAHKLGNKHKQVVSAWEKRNVLPSISTLVAISNIFGIVPAYFFTWTDDFEI